MFRVFFIWIILSGLSVIPAQSFGDNFKLAYPSLVHQGKSFEVSIITSNEFEDSDKLDLYIIPKRGIKLDAVLLQSGTKSRKINFNSASSEGYLYDAVMCSIDLSQSFLQRDGSFFQILLKFKSDFIDYSEIEFYGEFRKHNRIVNYLQSSNKKLFSDYSNHYRAKINFYNANIAGEKSLLLRPQSEFSILPDVQIKNNLLFEFWIKLETKGLPFLEIRNRQTNLIEYRLITNQYQILTCESDFNTENEMTPHFIPWNVWQHFEILFSFKNNKIEFYCNGDEFSRYELSPSLSVNDIDLSFINNTKGKYQIDQVRIIDFNESISASVRNRNFSNFISDSSEVKMQFNFNRITLTDLMQSKSVSMNNITLISSDAPIFERAPELNIKVMNNYYELNWTGGDYTSAVFYTVERSEGESGFVEIYRTDADNQNARDYSYISDRKEDSEVIYFRVKQANKDGSIIYSSQLKVGQGDLEEFIAGQNFPNPFNPSTHISIEVLEDSEFEIVVYNLEGKEIERLYQGFLAKGEYQFKFDGSDLPSGIYLYKVSSTNFSQTKKMILAK